MTSLSNVTLIWSMIAAGALLLGLVHGFRWLLDREARADLAFALVAISFVGVAFTEIGGMQARDAAEWGQWVRWCHLPLFGLVVGTIAFVHLYLGTGRRWLMWTVIGLRGAILVLNFSHQPNANFSRVDSIEQVRFLGETVSVVGEAIAAPWQLLGTLASLLLVVYVLDAGLSRWRSGDADDKRGAVLIGGSVFLMVVIAGTYTQLVIYGLVRLPFLITPAFILPLLAMSFELGFDMLRASRLARELRESERRLELAAGSANLGLWEWDGRRQRVFSTRHAREIFGFGSEDTGDFRRWLERVHPEDAHRLTAEIARAIDAGVEYAAEFRITPGHGATRWIAARGRAEPAGPGPSAVVRGIFRDITDLRRAEDETHELRRELAHASRVSMLGQLASSLAHELSQPLGAILRNAEAAELLLAEESPDHEELKAIVTDILRDDRRARDVVERLRNMLKRREADIQPVSVDALMQDVAAIVRVDAGSRGVSLEHIPAPDLPPVRGDRVQLSQVLLNLVLNAMDAVAGQPADRRGVVLSSRRAGNGDIELCVADRGHGIPAGDVRRIFEPFYTTKDSGMGIGLAVSRTIAEAHGGSLTAENDERGGATFRLTLPVRENA